MGGQPLRKTVGIGLPRRLLGRAFLIGRAGQRREQIDPAQQQVDPRTVEMLLALCAATNRSSIAWATVTAARRSTIRAAPFSEWAARMQSSSRSGRVGVRSSSSRAAVSDWVSSPASMRKRSRIENWLRSCAPIRAGTG
jgi:hypothetical protein